MVVYMVAKYRKTLKLGEKKYKKKPQNLGYSDVFYLWFSLDILYFIT